MKHLAVYSVIIHLPGNKSREVPQPRQVLPDFMAALEPPAAASGSTSSGIAATQKSMDSEQMLESEFRDCR